MYSATIHTLASKKCCPQYFQFDINCFVQLAQTSLNQGVNISVDNDGGDQRYVTPNIAVLERGADLVIVGRGVTGASDMVTAVSKYQSEAWSALAEKYTL